MKSAARPAVERRHPPNLLMKAVNPVTRRLIRHGRAADQLLILHYVGRRSGKHYDVPAGYHLIDGGPTVFTNSGWRHNFAGGRDIEVTLRGERRPAHASLVSDPSVVARVYRDLIDMLGWRDAQRRLGIRINVEHAPTLEDLEDAVVRSGLSMVRLSLLS